jgi:hypothetical protein
MCLADDLLYLQNPIWWAGMLTSELARLERRLGRMDKADDEQW